ncbi:MAG: twin-arginine translocase subunit TatB [bacterium]|nr:twin-arginine translocase subunit TatB [bacterium]
MFGPLGVPELIFILVLALLIFGPRKLPQIGRTVGKGLAEFRKASNDLKRTINAEMIDEELRESDPRTAVREIADLAKSSVLGNDTGRRPQGEPPTVDRSVTRTVETPSPEPAAAPTEARD